MKNFIYKTRRALRPKVAIFVTIRVENYITDPVKISVSIKNFLKQIEFLNEFATIITPDQFFGFLNNGKNYLSAQYC